MPRYFIHTDDGDSRQDDIEGFELTGPQAARSLALRALADMLQDRVHVSDRRRFIVMVEDEEHRHLYEAILDLSGRWDGA